MFPLLLLILATIISCALVNGGALYVFGDSLSDTGRLHTITLGLVPPEPYWEGRFSSGPLWIEYVAQLQGLDLENYAVGAAETSDSEPQLFGLLQMTIPSTHDQINQFATHIVGTEADIAVLEIGGNNIITGLPLILANHTTVDRFVNELADTVAMQAAKLVSLGFHTVYVTNAPALQAIPLIRLEKRVDVAAEVVRAYNAALEARVPTGSSVVLVDIEGFMHQAVQIAKVLGWVKDTESSCVGGEVLQDLFGRIRHPGDAVLRLALDPRDALVCDNPEDFFFWDPIHPNDRVHRLFGYYVNELIKGRGALLDHSLVDLIARYNLGSDVARPVRTE